jgi:hypothetical protein
VGTTEDGEASRGIDDEAVMLNDEQCDMRAGSGLGARGSGLGAQGSGPLHLHGDGVYLARAPLREGRLFQCL